MTITITARVDKVTAGTKRFAEDHEEGTRPLVGSIYVVKSALAELGDPDVIVVTIDAVVPAEAVPA
ncbi:MAG TPA: hypothetical protein VIX41_03580 [Acidimicrobiales bacterium]